MEEATTKREVDFNLSAEALREIWKEQQITERLADGQTYEKGSLEGNIVDLETIGDKTAVLVEKGGRFAIAELDHEKGLDLKRGDAVKIKDTELSNQSRDKSKQFNR